MTASLLLPSAPATGAPPMAADLPASPTASPTVRIHAADNVVIARRQLLGGKVLAEEGGLVVLGLVPPGHKLATHAIAAGEAVRRYNQIIGHATQPIAPGQHVHSHNLAFGNFERAHEVGASAQATAFVAEPTTFMGIVRPDGRVATRNFIGVLTSAGRFVPAAAKKAELARIGRYYATESMLVWNPVANVYDAAATPSTGTQTLEDHYRKIIAGELVTDLREHSVF